MTTTYNAPRVLAQLHRIDQLDPVEGNTEVNIATVGGTPCAVPTGTANVGDVVLFIGPDTFVPRTDKNAFLFDDKVNRYHLCETKATAGQLKGNGYLGDGLRIKPTLVAGKLSAGLAITVHGHQAVLDTISNIFGGMVPASSIHEAKVSSAVAELIKPQAWTQCVAFQVVWDRPGFVADPTVMDIKSVMPTLGSESPDKKYLAATIPSNASEMVVYFVRHDSAMAKCLEHRTECGKVIGGVGRVGVCNPKFDFEEAFSSPYWAVVINADLSDKIAAYNKNIAVEGFYTSATINKRVVRAFIVSGIWDLDAQTRWSWNATKRQAIEWGLKHVSDKDLTTVKDIIDGKAKRQFLKKGSSLFFRAQDGKTTFSQQ